MKNNLREWIKAHNAEPAHHKFDALQAKADLVGEMKHSLHEVLTKCAIAEREVNQGSISKAWEALAKYEAIMEVER